MPGTVMHELIGLLCLGIYVILPGFFILQLLAKKFINSEARNTYSSGSRLKKTATGIFFLAFVLMIFSGLRNKEGQNSHQLVQKQMNGYTINYLPNDITKIENSNALIYRKKIQEFYSTEHNPMICWTGSGYSFQKVKESKIGNNTVYAGLLVKDKDTLHTAWWYENGLHKTISQTNWRWRVMRGEEKFYLVNVSAENEEFLKNEIEKLDLKDL